MKIETNSVREWFYTELNKIAGVKAYKSEANFILSNLIMQMLGEFGLIWKKMDC